MATKAKVCARGEDAQRMLQQGVAPAAVVTILTRRHKVSRATAYRDVEAAQIRLEKTQRDNPDLIDAPEIDAKSIAALIQGQLINAIADEDHKATLQLLNALEKAKRFSGYGVES